jgi:hypothetical protein
MISKKSVTAIAMALLFTQAIVLSGCAIIEPEPPQATMGPHSKVFEASYDEVWRAVQKSLVSYPIQLNNIDQGIIETDSIKGPQVWRPPFNKNDEKTNQKYILRVNVVKGQVNKKESTRVTILKSISIEKDFFSGEDRLPSDGYEEKALIYRVQREILLERSLKKSFERKSS